MTNLFLPGVPEDLVRASLAKAGGDELRSGKFANPQSSAALAANGFGWFLEWPDLLPAFPCLGDIDWPARSVDVERQMWFPWPGGRHPWLDAAVETGTCLIGVESKRFEPFRSGKEAKLSEAYDRDVWGDGMEPWCGLRDILRAEPRRFAHLDAAQLVKHAFGLVSESSRIGKEPFLLYLFADPASVKPEKRERHRAEIEVLAEKVQGSRVRFAPCSWREWLLLWNGEAVAHASALIEAFDP
ncbi:hypothetical protein B2G71_12895 [Novosphingobium sp. PC22D]|uniref:PGN_0703 family putative restriction endonuclease n=1 Tax=Novosphingobium sp. PC22D TaxID=1962403 RepID=UPI000BEF9CFE|nr:hypothetical protein [Novosphingobium sp. PC22D]PEQ12381.1 hypothetical protein B2G71_12895 [Novosphingobium sp. PC22D]